MPAKAGIQKHFKILDSRLCWDDADLHFTTYEEIINIGHYTRILGPSAPDLLLIQSHNPANIGPEFFLFF